ncbi:hypothetical protein [Pseudomonas rubra]|uniref:Uncharacterized protein n=1 Tax=Pseudomonas rubra TaxID=2942627 RepID=A0ABT5P8I9_9PSED|nr:hypothetical protein [Pseudomonas rubra]MDD1014481.1 hypothetical protein [Pseudomonas rubra]MDD1037896.1 hypothetical protein [Pseudomonas rubra]MDD1155329.1 hypothetical protein [Pseudomonas rubra]
MANGFLSGIASSICGALLLGLCSTPVLAVDDNLVQFNPATCEFGAQLEPYYAKAIAKRHALSVQALEEEVSYPVDLPFHGIKVTAVFIGYEWHGIYFDAAPDQVRSLFRQLGYRVAEDGDMSASGDEVAVTASIIETSEKAREQGLSALTCGI